MRVFSSRFTLMIGVALLLVAGSLALAPAVVHPADPPVAIADPASIVGSGITTNGYADGVIAGAQARLQKRADDSSALSDLGLGYLQKARETADPTFYGQAEKALQQALAARSSNLDALGGLGSMALARHQFHDALVWGHKAQALNPQRAYAYGVIADAQTELGDYDGAVETLQKMVNLRPDLSSYSRISYARELHGDVDGAITAMQQAVEAGGPAPENHSWAQVQLGNLYFNSGRLAEAEQAYNAALIAYPGYLHARAGLAQVRAAQGRTAEAITLYKQAIAVVPLPQYLSALGDLYTATGAGVAAGLQYDTVSQIFRLFAANGVEVNIEQAAFLADRDQQTATAVRLAQTAAAGRTDIHTQDTLAWTLYRAGQYPAAQEAINQATRLGTRNALILFHQGMIAGKLGDSTAARKYLGAALAVNPFFSVIYVPQAKVALDSLGK